MKNKSNLLQAIQNGLISKNELLLKSVFFKKYDIAEGKTIITFIESKGKASYYNRALKPIELTATEKKEMVSEGEKIGIRFVTIVKNYDE